MKETLQLLQKIKSEMGAFDVEIRHGDALDQDSPDTTFEYLTIVVYMDWLEHPVEIDLNVEKVLTDGVSLDKMLEELKFEVSCLEGSGDFYHHGSGMIH